MNELSFGLALLGWTVLGGVFFAYVVGDLCEKDIQGKKAHLKFATVVVVCGPLAIAGTLVWLLIYKIDKISIHSKVAEWIKR